MKIIKNNYNKKIKVTCNNCKSKISAKIMEFEKEYNCSFIICPVCKERIYRK